MSDDLATLRAELRQLRAHQMAQDFIIAALAAHLQAVTMPGFLAAAFDSAATTASRMSLQRDNDEILQEALRHIEQVRSAFAMASAPAPQHRN